MNSMLRQLLFGIVLIGLISCSKEKEGNRSSAMEPTLLEVSAIYDAESDQHLFKTEKDTISAGWTTLRFANQSPMLHFVFFDYMPGDRTSEDLLAEVSPVYQESSYLNMEGKNEEAMAKFGELPEWANQVVFRGGSGFVSPGKTTEVTLFMKPGNYVMECYIKTADGTMHYTKGMIRDLHVTNDTTDAKAPRSPAIEITTTDNGFEIDGEPTSGNNLVAVHFNESNPGFIGRDIHVVQLDENSNLDEIATWMDFLSPEGLISSAENPGPATFVGGTHEMPNGNTVYFTVELEPGRYAWISEQPFDNKTIEEFTVSASSEY